MRAWPQWQPDEWTQRLHARDHEAWQYIYELCVFTCQARIDQQTREEHADLAGDAYVHVMGKLLAGHQVYAMRGFVVKTALHFWYHVLEQKVKQVQIPEQMDSNPRFVAPPPSTLTPTEQQQRDEAAEQATTPERTALYLALDTCFEALPAEDRTMIRMSFAGEIHATIASVLKMKVGTVTVRIHRAFKTKLQRCLDQRGYSIEQVIRTMRQKGGSDA
ncbi:MAG: sigma-70 family RNA polymerase sigma factor [Chloroflexales bacterium]